MAAKGYYHGLWHHHLLNDRRVSNACTVKILKLGFQNLLYPKIWTMWLYHRVLCPNDADGMAHSVDPDQTQCRPWSEKFTLCAQTWLKQSVRKVWIFIVCSKIPQNQHQIFFLSNKLCPVGGSVWPGAEFWVWLWSFKTLAQFLTSWWSPILKIWKW